MTKRNGYFGSYAFLVLLLVPVLGPGSRAKGCVSPPPTLTTNLRIVIITLGPPLRITLVFDPWTTFGANASTFCSCGFRFPTALIDTVDEIRLVETGTNNVVAGFDVWTSNGTTSAAIEGILGAGAGNQWFGFLNDLAADVSPDIEVDFQVDVTLNASVSVADVVDTLNQDKSNLVFSDEADSSGNPLDTHQAFVDVTDIAAGLGACCLEASCSQMTQPECKEALGHFQGVGTTCTDDCQTRAIPAVSEWGLLITALLGLTAGTVVIMRRRRTPAGA